jgi:hypothetical protein
MQQANRADVSETRPDASDFNPAFDRAALKNLRLRKPSYRLIDSPISTDRYIVLTNRSAYERAALERGHTALGSTFGGDVMSNIAKAVVGAFVAATSCAQLASAGSTHQYQKSAPSAERTQVGLYTSWKSDCIPVGGSVTMVQKPAHGTVDFAPASEVMEARYNGTTDCSGRTMDGTGIFYTSSPSFHGRDGFVVHTKANSGPYETDVTYSIDVK